MIGVCLNLRYVSLKLRSHHGPDIDTILPREQNFSIKYFSPTSIIPMKGCS